MDHLFTKDVDQAMEALRELEPEMREMSRKWKSCLAMHMITSVLFSII